MPPQSRPSYAWRTGYLEQMVEWATNEDRQSDTSYRLHELAAAYEDYQSRLNVAD
jgi:hypothetical protein